MAVALAFGVMFSTFVTLILVPAGYLTLVDVREGLARLLRPEPARVADRSAAADPDEAPGPRRAMPTST